MTSMPVQVLLQKVWDALKLDENAKTPCSFAFSKTKPIPGSWKCFSSDLAVPFWHIYAPGAKQSEIKKVASGISTENFMLLADLGEASLLVIKTFGKGKGEKPLFKFLRKNNDYEEAANALRKYDFKSDDLIAHASLQAAKELLEKSAGAVFINKGLFSNYFLKERLVKSMSERGRNLSKESQGLYPKIDEFVSSDPVNAVSILKGLGFNTLHCAGAGYPEFTLSFNGEKLNVCCVVAPIDSLDFRIEDMAAPSYQAVSKLRDFTWVILSNGRLWRLYCSKSPSESTSYFELNMEGVQEASDKRMIYFTAMFSAQSFVLKGGVSDIDIIYEGGIIYTEGLEEDLRRKVFSDQLFLNLARSVLVFNKKKRYSEQELEQGKIRALKLLYRLLFVLYAEARGLMPIGNENYRAVSLENMRLRLDALEKEPEGTEAWDSVRALFSMIHQGNPSAQMPEYDGELFAEEEIDGFEILNKHLVPALKDLMVTDAGGIDYLNLGVRQLGSIYEALLEYSIKQADSDLMVFKDSSSGKNGLTIMDASFASDLQAKPKSFIHAGEIYLTVGGLARKGTGSYYTPDKIVRFLAKKGLEPHFQRREALFRQDMQKLRSQKARNSVLELKTIDDLLGLEVVDPAMGSGHFLVAAANEITSWAISLLQESPDAPLNVQVEEDRRMILEEQAKRGVMLDADQLTDAVILKRMVMKRCVFGVDINPMAVELAKLSLWLESFTIGTPLTFLDHHMRCGDSLMGLWRRSLQESQTRLQRWTGELEAAGKALFNSVSQSHDLNLEELRQSREGYDRAREMTRPQEEMLDLQVASIIDPEAEDASLARKFGAFHWEYEFPDAFIETEWGFDLVVMNPPWDAVKPEDDDFFSGISPGFRRIKSKPEKKKVMEKLLKDPVIKAAYKDYREKIEQRLKFYRSSEYSLRGSGDTNLWKLFMERGMRILAKGGTLSVVVPSGIVTDEGGKPLREKLFNGKIRGIFEFENKRGIFSDVHKSYKFALLIWDRAEPVLSFPAAFYLHSMEALEYSAEQEKFLQMPIELIKLCAPESLSFPEIRTKKELEIFAKIYRNHPLISNPTRPWRAILARELDRTNDSDKFRSDGLGWLLMDGKSFNQFNPDFEKPQFSVIPERALEKLSKIRVYSGICGQIHESPRLAFRAIARSTDTRTVIACILPPRTVSDHNVDIIVIRNGNEKLVVNKLYYKMISYLAGIFNSFTFDFLVRARISIYFSFFIFYQTPIPVDFESEIPKRISDISARLSSPDERFTELTQAMGVPFGPLSMKERLEMTAELNALVAHHYSLTRDELSVILESFSSFEEDPELEKLEEIKWSDTLMRKFNGEVRRRVMGYFDALEKGPDREEAT